MEGQRVKTTGRCTNLYLKVCVSSLRQSAHQHSFALNSRAEIVRSIFFSQPGQYGVYLHPFKQDPENTGLFEWDNWIHPLSCRSAYAVAYKDIELVEQPDTEDEDEDGVGVIRCHDRALYYGLTSTITNNMLLHMCFVDPYWR